MSVNAPSSRILALSDAYLGGALVLQLVLALAFVYPFLLDPACALALPCANQLFDFTWHAHAELFTWLCYGALAGLCCFAALRLLAEWMEVSVLSWTTLALTLANVATLWSLLARAQMRALYE